MKQRSVIRAVAIAGLLAMLAALAMAGGQKRLSIPDTSGILQGSMVVIPVRLDSVLTSADSVVSYQLQIQFSSYALTLDSVLSQGTLTAGFGSLAYNVNPAGVVNIAAAGNTALTGSGVLLYLRFATKQAGYAYVSFSDTLHNFFNQNDGRPRILLKSGTVSVTALPTISISPSSGLLVTGEHLQFYGYGGKTPYAWSVTNSSVASIDSTGMLTALNRGFTKVVLKDSSGLLDTTSGSVEVRSVSLSVPDTSTYVGYTIDVPIRCNDLTGLGILSGQLTLTFNGDLLTPIAIIQSGTLLASYPSVTSNLSNKGSVSVAFAESTPLHGSGVLMYVRFSASTINSGSTGIAFSNVQFSQNNLNQNILAKTIDGSAHVQALGTLNLYRKLVNLIVGDTIRFSTTNGTPPFTWSTSDSTVASIDSTGLVTAKKNGSFRVMAKDSVGRTGISDVLSIYNAFVAISDLPAGRGAILDVPIMLRRISAGLTASALQLIVQFDTTFMQAVGVVTAGTLTNGWSTSSAVSGNTFHVASAFSSPPLSTTGTLVILRFQVSSSVQVGNVTSIQFHQLLLNDGTDVLTFDGTATVVAVPLTPSLTSPSSGAVNQSTYPTLQWSQPLYAQSYRLQVATDTSFAHLVLDDSTLVVGFRQVPLSINTTYYWRVNAKNVAGTSNWSVRWSFTTGSTSGVGSPEKIPATYALDQNFPNPFNPSTVIRYGLESRSTVRLEIFNVIGQRVKVLANEMAEPGFYEKSWNADVASGIYFYRIEAIPLDNPAKVFVEIKRMILLK